MEISALCGHLKVSAAPTINRQSAPSKASETTYR
jgi:hypothetical protein